MMRSFCALGVIFLLATPAFGAVNIVNNGGFETPQLPHVVPNGAYWNIGGGFGDWSIGSVGSDHRIDLVRDPYWNPGAKEGSQVLDLNGQDGIGGTTLSQNLTTEVDRNYHVSFWYAHNPNLTTTATATFALLDGATTLLNGNLVSGPNDVYVDGIEWSYYSGSFKASSTTTTLLFTETSNHQYGGILLDDIQVIATPEPVSMISWGLLSSFAVASTAWSRRKRRAA